MNQWPPHSKITCFNLEEDVVAKSIRSRLDLSDSLMLEAEDGKREVYIEVAVNAANWKS